MIAQAVGKTIVAVQESEPRNLGAADRAVWVGLETAGGCLLGSRGHREDLF